MKHYTIEDGAVPYHYSLSFEPDLKTFRFKARAVIKLRFSKAKSSLRLNAKELKVMRASVLAGGVEQEASFRLEGDSEAVFGFKEPVEGEAELIVEYEGQHNDRLYGFYRARVDQKEYMLSSQCEAANARSAFPCLDEPLHKATFDVTMLIDEGLEAVSNMPIKRKEKKGAKMEWVFETTPRMSTYLLYLGVGKFERLERKSGRIRLSVLATKGKKEYMHLALDYGGRLFADLQSYFRVEYPLPKLDLLAIPDFAAGAMENWGAIAFRETALLGSEEKSTVIGRQRIAEVVGHELAHMWFGDLVTMAWWDDMWLNESFATYMEYKAVERVFPEWKAMLKYYLDSVGFALSADGVKNTHPISVKVDTVGEAEELFDAIGYNKGGSVLLMLEDFVGPEIFRDGLTRYIKKHSYGNATRDDLWASIEEECRSKGKDLPVMKVMDDWLTREGYPVVSVKERGGSFELSQERFTISGNMAGTWKIPISYLSDKGEGKLLMEGKTARVEARWLKLNHRQAGFYRVAYEPKNLKALGKMVREGKLGELDAWGIENDLFAFVRSGAMALPGYLGFVGENCMDCAYPANVNISGHLSWLNSIAYKAPLAKGAAELSARYHGRMLERLGWAVRKGESSSDTRLRSLSIAELGLLGDPATVAKAESLFDDPGINPNIRSAVFSTVMFNKPDEARFERLLGMYKGDGAPEEKIIALQTLGMAGERRFMDKALELCLSDSVRLQDSYIIMGSVSGNPLGRMLYKEWALENWQAFKSKYDPASHMLKGCVQSFGMLADRKSEEELEGFFSDQKNMRDDIKVAVRQTIERVAANVAFIERNQ